MAGTRLPIIGKTRFNPSLSASSTTFLVLARELDVANAQEVAAWLRVHGTPTLTAITSVKMLIWAISSCSEEPGTDFIHRNKSTLDPERLAVIEIPGSYTGIPANNGWANMAPVNFSSTQFGSFGGRLRAMLEIITTTGTPALDLFLSADLDVKA